MPCIIIIVIMLLFSFLSIPSPFLLCLVLLIFPLFLFTMPHPLTHFIPLFLLNIYHSLFIHIQVKMKLIRENAALNPREENCGLHQTFSLATQKNAMFWHECTRVCIICNKDRWSRDRKFRKTVRDKYSQCQTLTAGQLLEAAQRKKDERLLYSCKSKIKIL